jgi:hypothetical protein
MSRSRRGGNRDRDEILRGELRKAKKQIKQLQKENQRLIILLEHQNRPIVVRKGVSKTKTPVQKGDCPDCGVGILEVIDLGLRKMHVCKECGFRKVIKLDGKDKT